MFYDERIENTKGIIARRAIVISFFLTFILAEIHCTNLLRNAPDPRYYWFALPDVVIFFGTLITLMVGIIRNILHRNDERIEAEQNKFYLRSASRLIKISLGAFAFDLPIALYIGSPLTFADIGPSGIIYVLLFVVGIYVVHSFRKNDIYFNYSIMDNDRYYAGVLKNIGKMALHALALLCVSAVSFIGIVVIKDPVSARILSILLDTGAYFVGTVVEISLLYLLYSFLEKCSYNSEDSISKSTVITLFITIFIYGIYTAVMIFVDSLPISQASAARLIVLVSEFDIYIKLSLLIFLTYLGYEYQRIHQNKLLSVACSTILLSETLSVLAGQIAGGLVYVFMPEIMSKDAYMINRILSTVNMSIQDVSSLADIVGFVLITFALIHDKRIAKAHLMVIGAFATLVGFDAFLRTQVNFMAVNKYHCLAEIAVLCYYGAVVAHVARKTKKKTAEFPSAT